MREVEGGVFLNEPNICLIAETLRRLFNESITKECGAELTKVTVGRKDTGEAVTPGRHQQGGCMDSGEETTSKACFLAY